MKKAAMRLIGLALVLACLLAYIPQSHAVQPPERPNELFLTQNVSGTCTLCSAAMMIRTSMYLQGNSNWTAVTENAVRPNGWMEGVGLKWFFSHTVGNTTVKVGHENVSGISESALKELLDEHPEGIVLYCGKLPHAVFLTGYDGDVFYCADTVKGISNQQVTLQKSWLGIKYGSQAAVLKKVTAYWYVTDYMENGHSIQCDCSTKYAGTYMAVPAAAELRIRAGHGTNYAILGTMPYGAKVTVLRANGSWAHIIYNGIVGYASMDYLKKLPCEHQYGDWTASSVAGQEIRTCALCGATESRDANAGQMGTITGSDLRIRAGAGTGYAIKGYLQRGDRVEILETKQVGSVLWGRIDNGWISMDYVELDEVEPEPQVLKGTVTAYSLCVRSNAGLNYAIKSHLPRGTRVEILETKQVGTSLWGRIDNGWICMDFVELDEVEPEPQVLEGTVTAYSLRVRTGAGTNYGVKDLLPRGTRVEILETKQVGSTLWGRIDNGWIDLSFVELDNAEPEPIIGTVTAYCLRIRSDASMSASVVDFYYQGERIEILETKVVNGTTWGHTNKGWVSMDYVS